mmetsp:Transcript_2718/g.3572  ORF Transcript_2718/g.3572 Transcript_2718/m.3572 type:complete len:321 (-) Transcript_2718:405-1367(-)
MLEIFLVLDCSDEESVPALPEDTALIFRTGTFFSPDNCFDGVPDDFFAKETKEVSSPLSSLLFTSFPALKGDLIFKVFFLGIDKFVDCVITSIFPGVIDDVSLLLGSLSELDDVFILMLGIFLSIDTCADSVSVCDLSNVADGLLFSLSLSPFLESLPKPDDVFSLILGIFLSADNCFDSVLVSCLLDVTDDSSLYLSLSFFIDSLLELDCVFNLIVGIFLSPDECFDSVVPTSDLHDVVDDRSLSISLSLSLSISELDDVFSFMMGIFLSPDNCFDGVSVSNLLDETDELFPLSLSFIFASLLELDDALSLIEGIFLSI